MTNTTIRILKLTADRPFITDAIIVDALWPGSKQHDKKCAAAQLHLRHLVESGYVIRVKAGLWRITEVGKTAAARASQKDRQVMMRMVR